MRPRQRPSKVVPAGHDPGYKRLFSHPQAVEDLFRGFLREDWVEQLDLSTLERVGSSFISGDLRERRSDVIWKVRWRGQARAGVYLYVLLELQSTSYAFMAVRLLTYVGLLLEEIIHREKLRPGDRLPAILPLVFYNGKRPWLAPLDLASLFEEMPASLRRYLPRLRYLVLDENRLDLDRPELAGNRMASLFRIETCGDVEKIPHLTRDLATLLASGEEPELRRTIAEWLAHVLRRMAPGATIPDVIDLEDVSMLEENLLDWSEKKRREGQYEGKREFLLRQLERRFGPLSEEIRHRVEEIRSDRRLERLADKILTARSLREMGL
jgi:predicted transposase YdaD